MYLHFLQTNEQKEAFIELAYRFANIDGNINKKENNCLRTILFELDIVPTERAFSTERELEEIVSAIKDESVRNVYFLELLMLVHSDGDYNDDEKEASCQLQRLFGISDEKFAKCVQWVKQLDQLKIDGIKLIL